MLSTPLLAAPAQARMCAPNGYCPVTKAATKREAHFLGMSSGQCGTWSSDVPREDQDAWTVGTFTSRSCMSGETLWNVMGVYQGSWGFQLDFSINGLWGGPVH